MPEKMTILVYYFVSRNQNLIVHINVHHQVKLSCKLINSLHDFNLCIFMEFDHIFWILINEFYVSNMKQEQLSTQLYEVYLAKSIEFVPNMAQF